MKTERVCKACSKEFLVENREINRGRGVYCSRQCSSKSYKGTIISTNVLNATCANCGKDFHKSQSSINNSKSGLVFCCRQCKDNAQRIGGIEEIQPPHYGSSNAYRKVALRNSNKICNRCGYDEHPEILQVHHKDRNRDNNDLSNLEILCPNCHMIEHHGVLV